MKLDKKKEKELMQVYEAYWAEYLNGNVDAMQALLDDSYTQIGSAESEVFSSKKEAVQFLVDTIDQVAGKLEMRNRSMKLEQQDHLILIHEVCDLYALADKKWVFYSKFRASTLLQEKKEGWKITHQHSSFPDTKTEAGQNVAIDKIAEENSQLREAIKRRTIELEHKNRELQIEAALERVRARSMGMQNSSELAELVDTVFKELTQLDFELGWCMINIIDAPSLSNTVWTINSETGKIPESFHMKFEDYPFHDAMMKGYKERATKYIYVLERAEKKEYDEYLFNETEFRKVPQEAQAASRAMEKYVCSFSFSNFGGLQTVGNEPLSNANMDILARFGKVFDLTYTRFNDLLKAEQQAREVQVELALEKVRSRTMAMQHSDELAETSFLLDQQVRALGINTWGCAFNIYGENDSTEWFGNEAVVLPTYTVPRTGIFEEYYQKGQKGESLHIQEFSGDECVAHYEYMSSLPVIGEVLKNLKETNKGFPTYQIDHVVYFKYGYLLFITKEDVPEAHNVFKRFAKVFEQTYTRFLDLEKAEEQAREAQIETALERVRSRMMSMQHSTELEETNVAMYQQLNLLGIVSEGATVYIAVVDEETETAVQWLVNDKSKSIPMSKGVPKRTPMTEHPELINTYEAWKRKEPILIRDLSGEKLIEFGNYLNSLPSLKGIEIPIDQMPDRMIWSEASFSQGTLGMIHYEPLPEASLDILVRFSKVFEQTYTRFLDLQKAEAQAREAQIEAALERVRSQSLGMQTSEDLSKVTTEMFKQLREFGGDLYATGIVFCDKHKGHVEQWHSLPDAGMISPFIVPIDLDYIHKYRYDQWKKGTALFSIEIPSDFIEQHFNDIFELPSAQVVLKEFEANKTPMPSTPDWEIDYGASFKHGYLLVSSLQPFKEAEILPRFAKVFEQTYTRFLDLQKAEAQAREAQIEAALERVRSRGMAMHKSEELKEVVKVIFDQMAQLKINADHAGIVVDYEPKKDFHFWVADNQDIPARITVPYLDLPWDKQFTKAKKKGKEFFTTQLDFEEKNSFYKKLLPHIKGLTKKAKDFYLSCPGLAASTVIEKDIGLYIENFSGIPFTDEENSILMRFGKVFQQTYTRFLDLQKAEAQAREAQIETALEKVRSRSLAMHKPDELQEVITVIAEKLQELGVIFDVGGVILCTYFPDNKDVVHWITTPDFSSSQSYLVPYFDNPIFNDSWDSKNRGDAYFSKEFPVEAKNSFFEYAFEHSDYKHFPDDYKQHVLEAEKHTLTAAWSKNSAIIIPSLTGVVPSVSDAEIIKRFAKVFEQAYIRFMDLQKAEAQAREAQIEAALERVRSRTMGMQKSEELFVITDIFHQQAIQFSTNIHNSGFNINYKETDGFNLMMADSFNVGHTEYAHIPYIDNPIYNDLKEAKEMGLDFVAIKLSFEEKNIFWNHFFNYFQPESEQQKNELLAAKGFTISIALLDNVTFYFANYDGISFSEEENDLVKRFGATFQQAYTRFLDLQKAETQTREAQIEMALEKVRTASMTMQKGGELAKVISVVFTQLKALGIDSEGCGLNLYDKEEGMDIWMSGFGEDVHPKSFHISYFDHPYYEMQLNAWKKKEKYRVIAFEGDLKRSYDHQTFSNKDFFKLPKDIKKAFIAKEKTISSVANMKYGMLEMIGDESLSEDQADILCRFAGVFEQTYTRFLDLQKAEAQAREAQIEAALERVRSRSMAMHKSKEMLAVIDVVSEQLQQLNLNFDTVSFAKNNQEGDFTFWITSKGQQKPLLMEVPTLDSPVLKGVYKAQKKGITFLADVFSAEVNKEWHEHLIKFSDLKHFPDKIKDFILNAPGFARSSFLLKNIDLYVGNYRAIPFTDEENSIFRRFAHVFEQTYTRFLDLQKAEAQVREAQIEAALERVRSRTMGMQKSEELSEVNQVIYEQLIALNFNIDGVGFAVDHRESDDWDLWQTDGSVPHPYQLHIPYFDHPLPNAIIEAKKNGLELLVLNLTFNEKNKMLDQFFKYVSQPQDVKKALYSTPAYVMSKVLLKNVDLYIHRYTGIPFTNAENAILIRFTKVFEQTYTRFNDLKQAEEQTLEAVKRTSIDRVRAEIASMRTAKDLERITPLIWKELIVLNIPFIRCGVFIMDESQEVIHNYLSTPDGKAIAVFHLPYTTPGAIANILKHWQQRKIFLDHWDEAAMEEFANVLVDQGIFNSSDQYLKKLPKGGFHLHFLPFNQGMLYVGNTTQLKDDEVQIIQSLANAFSSAYARYEDFNKLETAKQLVDKALVDLKQTQQQLVQSEKMASLGELTAGIAHEIQNPLNFVNNFSEVSKELLEEMMEEMQKGDVEEVKALAEDIVQNLEKINHHGKRADGIVKGMLQHSRTSSGEKELTDINALADEYLRLAYHGLRAKDKSFNATMKTDFDETIKSIDVIPQDMGRVILNLITNAFYACTERSRSVVKEKKNHDQTGYEPAVTITTKKEGNQVLIAVKDNGNGIPKKVLDKIFQPFFTTKPTGQGTGLGLSMSYDIVTKGHGGELKVETKKGEGSEFIIHLPSNN